VFFNLFAAMEPSANVCVAHGTLCSDPTFYSAKPLRTVFANFVPGQFGLFRGATLTPGSHFHKPDVAQNLDCKTLD